MALRSCPPLGDSAREGEGCFLPALPLGLEEQRSLLQASVGHPRDHLVFSMALRTGLRLGEIVGLNVGDVFFPDGGVKARIRLRAEIAKGGRQADVFLPAALIRKLEAFWSYKLGRREGLESFAPLFCNQGRRRISRRRVQVVFRAWQVIAGFGRFYPFHALRHTAVTNVYRASRDLFLAQRFARHASPLTTTIYTHVSDEEMFASLRALVC